MNEACDIVDHPVPRPDAGYRRERMCRTCGAVWCPDDGETGPCDDEDDRGDIWPAVIAATLACLCVAALLAATALADPFLWAAGGFARLWTGG